MSVLKMHKTADDKCILKHFNQYHRKDIMKLYIIEQQGDKCVDVAENLEEVKILLTQHTLRLENDGFKICRMELHEYFDVLDNEDCLFLNMIKGGYQTFFTVVTRHG